MYNKLYIYIILQGTSVVLHISISTRSLIIEFDTVFETAMENPSSSETQPPKYDLITVLSIDGGGIRGIIPGVILDYLESQLQVKYTEANMNPN